MQSTAVRPDPANGHAVAPASLAAAFADVPDPRRPASVTYPLAAMLTLAVAAILSAHTSVLAIAEWGRRQSADLLTQLGFPDGRTPCQSTLQRLFAKLDGPALAAVLAEHFAMLPPAHGDGAPQGVAIDGKAQRGRRAFDAASTPVHALTAFCHAAGIVLAQEPINHLGDKADAELTVAPALLKRIDWRGRVLTGDALFCQRTLCQQVVDAGGDYLFLVRANQPSLLDEIQVLFDPPLGALPLLDRREVRHLVATTDLTAYLTAAFAWPGLQQVFRLERTWSEHGHAKRQVLYGITSLAPEIGAPARLLALKRGHWAIENGLHRTKDVTFGEDASLIHAGQGPTVLALLRDTAVSLLHRAGIWQITARVREHSQYPGRAIALLLEAPMAHA